MMETIVVTRHPGMVTYLHAHGVIPEDCRVLTHATAEDVRGKRVVGVLPLHLAAEAAEVVEVPMDIPEHLRGSELSTMQVEIYARPEVTYRVTIHAHRPFTNEQKAMLDNIEDGSRLVPRELDELEDCRKGLLALDATARDTAFRFARAARLSGLHDGHRG
jgi:putative CRISPR-associated protein (TIGR02620 family)